MEVWSCLFFNFFHFDQDSCKLVRLIVNYKEQYNNKEHNQHSLVFKLLRWLSHYLNAQVHWQEVHLLAKLQARGTNK